MEISQFSQHEKPTVCLFPSADISNELFEEIYSRLNICRSDKLFTHKETSNGFRVVNRKRKFDTETTYRSDTVKVISSRNAMGGNKSKRKRHHCAKMEDVLKIGHGPISLYPQTPKNIEFIKGMLSSDLQIQNFCKTRRILAEIVAEKGDKSILAVQARKELETMQTEELFACRDYFENKQIKTLWFDTPNFDKPFLVTREFLALQLNEDNPVDLRLCEQAHCCVYLKLKKRIPEFLPPNAAVKFINDRCMGKNITEFKETVIFPSYSDIVPRCFFCVIRWTFFNNLSRSFEITKEISFKDFINYDWSLLLDRFVAPYQTNFVLPSGVSVTRRTPEIDCILNEFHKHGAIDVDLLFGNKV